MAWWTWPLIIWGASTLVMALCLAVVVARAWVRERAGRRGRARARRSIPSDDQRPPEETKTSGQ